MSLGGNPPQRGFSMGKDAHTCVSGVSCGLLGAASRPMQFRHPAPTEENAVQCRGLPAMTVKTSRLTSKTAGRRGIFASVLGDLW